MSNKQQSFQVTFLGTGTSQGVPVVTCNCATCHSTDSKDKRLRSSLMLRINNLNYVIDSGPDFRQQMLREQVDSLEAILFTHQHKDHIAGLDDVRPFNFRQQKDMTIYCDQLVREALHREFEYIFTEDKYPGIPQVDIRLIDKNTNIELENGEHIIPIEVMHYKLPVLAFRYRDFTYITDAKHISVEEIEKIKGTRVLVVNSLRHESHISHFNLEEALAFIEIIKPEKAYLTHISHLLGKHEYIKKILPPHVFLAYDGLQLELS